MGYLPRPKLPPKIGIQAVSKLPEGRYGRHPEVMGNPVFEAKFLSGGVRVMQLWLVRHAVAVERIPNGLEDGDRQLTAKGRKHFKALARQLESMGVVPDLIITSPLVRAVQTTEILRRATGLKKKQVRTEKFAAPGMDARRLVRALRNVEAETVAVVGHEPDMSACAQQMLSGGRLLFGKGNIACIEFEDGPTLKSGRLAWFLTPRLARKKN